MTQAALSEKLQAGALDARLTALCGCTGEGLAAKKNRLATLLSRFGQTFGQAGEAEFFAGPGRTEIGGNHTDHQHGCVLAAAVDLDALACAGKNDRMVITLHSEGYPAIIVDLSDLSPQKSEREGSAALVRGVAARMTELGYTLGGFDAVMDSTVLGGSGLSSSAAFEVLVGVIFNHLYCNDALDMVAIAQIGQWAENHYFGKPCGLMDQLASAVGGVVAIDFFSPEKPKVESLSFDLAKSGYALCIIDSGADHADLTEDYAAIPREMGAAAAVFGKKVLREVPYNEFWANIDKVRKQAGDRAALRAMHFYNDNHNAQLEAALLRAGDLSGFFALVRQSGLSSATLLQNLYCTKSPQQQAVNIALATALHLLQGKGAARVHGGGFAGTVQAFVPLSRKDEFTAGMEAVLGAGCCHYLSLRPVGGAVLSE